MIDQKRFLKELNEAGVEFITGVPDTLLNEFCLEVAASSGKNKHVIAANEGNALALAAGYHLATGTIPLVYMQNSGIGNALNPLISLTGKDVYSIPLILLIGWRGDPALNDHPQHVLQGKLTLVLMDDLEIPYKVVEDKDDLPFEAINWAVKTAGETQRPVALIARKGVFERGEKEDLSKLESDLPLSRETAIQCILDSLPADSIFVATTGRATRELHEVRNLRKEGHENDFLNVGAMGHTSSIAVGMALANHKRPVVCLDGDGAAIMHMGAMVVNADLKPGNLIHIILNNGVHESVGGQSTVGLKVDFTTLAEKAGYNTPGKALQKAEDMQEFLGGAVVGKGPYFVDLHIRKGMRQDMPPLKIDPLQIKQLFMEKNLKSG
jgi:phosphonopyruvate decarboxylase